ncbi:DUF432 domain-containing protein [Nitrosopumilus ureiphilus]|uniref:DUF432 domain-containing protein n=1 Tax=Nitrosopumilus ureiphilus TaxID=1470067 RepID=A0A7D5M5E9_9ARCH|nr:DUF432 domain-containing protein [Nitrosopumilus ureiphilus]QLH06973.1 hypothetical protein C5F50_07725 [Nitrosopumilus ureiphilus]
MSDSDSSFSNYGIYTIEDNTEFSLPNVIIKIEKIGDHVFSYIRKDVEDNIVKKIIPVSSSKLTIELSPVRPLNYPARRTSYMYLDFETPIFLSEGSAASVFVRCPIEIGIFLIHDGHKDSLDWVDCEPLNSRFCLYGTPESGTLCKYAPSEIVESYDDSIPFTNGVLKIDIKNDLDKGLTVSKIVFPITDNSVYYKNSKAIFDSLKAVLKKKLTLEILDVTSQSIETDWTKSPTYERVESIKRVDLSVE